MLESESDFLVEFFHGRVEGETVDTAEKDTIIWELIISIDAGLDVQSHGTTGTEGGSWNVILNPCPFQS